MANNTDNFVGSLLFTAPELHDTNDVCLCLSLSCRFCAATTTHEDQKKKTCNNDAAAVGKHDNLELLQPIHDSTVCNENVSNKKDIMGRPKISRFMKGELRRLIPEVTS